MPLPERHPVRITISMTKDDYAYIKDLIEQTEDSAKTVPGYIRRLVRHYVWSLREKEAIQKSEYLLQKIKKEMENPENGTTP